LVVCWAGLLLLQLAASLSQLVISCRLPLLLLLLLLQGQGRGLALWRCLEALMSSARRCGGVGGGSAAVSATS
jgi:hypothetical protein